MNDIDPIDALRTADPYSAATPLPRPTRSADDLFAEITGTDTATDGFVEPEPHATEHATSSPRRWRGKVLLPAAAAAAGLFTVGALVLDTGSNPSALALVTDAAETAASYDSGRVIVHVDVTEAPGDEGPGEMTIDYRYAQDDYSFEIDIHGFGLDDTMDDAGFGVIALDDLLYSSFDDSATFTEEVRTEAAEQRAVSGSFGDNNTDPTSIVELLRNTDGFERIESDGGETTYHGTLTLETLRRLEEGDVPTGLDMLVGDAADNGDIPDTIDVEVTITDDVLTTMTIEMDGPSPTGPVDATIVTTFTELGQPQPIVAPTAEQIVDPFSDASLPEGFEEAVAIVEEVMLRRPDLCGDVFSDDPPTTAGDDILQQIDDFATCLDEAGESAAADAFREMNALSALTAEG